MSAALVTRDEVPTRRRQRRALITGVVGPPIVWFAQLQANYALASWACRPGHRFVSIVVVGIAIAMSAGAGALAWQVWPRGEPLVGEPQRIEGARLLALLAVGSSLSFVVVLVATAIPLFIQRACD